MAHTWLEEVRDRAREGRPMCADRHDIEVVGPGVVRISCGSQISTYQTPEPAVLDEAEHLVDVHLRETSSRAIMDLVERVQVAEATIVQQHETISELRSELREMKRRMLW